MAEDRDPNVDPPEEDPNADPNADPPKEDSDPEKAKIIRQRDRAKEDRRKALEEVQRLKDKYEKANEDPVVKANQRLIHAEARTVMAAKGITEKEDQKVLSGFLALADVEVSGDGEVDTDAITERLEDLIRIVGKVSGDGRRVPRTDPRDRGGERTKPLSADQKRYRDMLAGK